jgi:hypothetical protein
MTPKHSPAIMIWGGIGIRGTTTVHLSRGSINSETHTEILGKISLSPLECSILMGMSYKIMRGHVFRVTQSNGLLNTELR